MFTGVFAGIAAFSATRMLGKFFEDANVEIQEAHDRARKLTQALMQQQDIRKKGIGYATEIQQKLAAHNTLLAKQGLLAADTLDTMGGELALAGVPAKSIAEAMEPMADMLVAMKGVNASEADGLQMSKAWGNAIKTGMVKPLKEFGVKLAPDAVKKFREIVKSGDLKRAHEYLLKIAKGFKGVNQEALKTPEGQIKKLSEDLGEMAERVGEKMLPARGKMAEAWRRVLPKLEPIITKIAVGVAGAFEKLAGYIENTVVPAFEKLTTFWETHPELQEGIKNLAINIGKATIAITAFGLIAAVNPLLWVAIAAGAVLLLANNWDTAARAASEYVKQQEAAGQTDSFMFKIVKFVDDLTSGFDVLGLMIDHYVIDKLNKVGAQLNKISQAWRKIPGLGWTAPEDIKMQEHVAPPGALERLQLKALPLPKAPGEEMAPAYESIYRAGQGAKDVVIPMEKMATTTDDLTMKTAAAVQPMVAFSGGLSGVAAMGPSAAAALTTMVNALGRMSTMTPPSIVAPPAAAAPPAAPTGLQHGGIVRSLTHAMLGERGPEAVLPLTGGRLRGMGVGGGTSVNFAPSITINGGASEENQRSLDGRLRALATDFIGQFKRAQDQERRLSYEAGYA